MTFIPIADTACICRNCKKEFIIPKEKMYEDFRQCTFCGSLKWDYKVDTIENVQKKLIKKLNKLSNEIHKYGKSKANYIHLSVEYIQKKADERKVSFDDMVKIIEKELMPNE